MRFDREGMVAGGEHAMMKVDLAYELRHEPKACDPSALCDALGLLGGPRSYRRQAAGVVVRCCAHDDRTPSLSVTRGDDGTVRARCFACQFSADAIGLTQKVQGGDFREALEVLARISGRHDLLDRIRRGEGPLQTGRPERVRSSKPTSSPIDPDLCARVYGELLDLCPLQAQSPVADYLERRAIFADAQAVGVGALPVAPGAQRALLRHLASRFGGVRSVIDVGLVQGTAGLDLRAPEHLLVIPWRGGDGLVRAIQRRRLDSREPRYLFPPRIAPTEPFGSEFVESARQHIGDDCPIVVTEGALDALARRKIARLTGERLVVVGAPSATTARPEWSAIFDGRHVVVAFDADKSGDEGAVRFAATCLASARLVERERPRWNDWNETLLRMFGAHQGVA